MASLVLLRNPLAPQTREQFHLPAGALVIDWLQDNYPQGFGMPIKFFVNGTEKDLDDLDYSVADDDVAVIALMPAEPVSTGTLIYYGIMLTIAAISLAASVYLYTQLPQAGKAGKPTTVYDVNGDQNTARIGEPIPVIYGSVLMAPDYVAQPYSYYDWSQTKYDDQRYNGIQYLDMLMCVGQGDVDVTDVYVGDTDATTIETGVVTWQAFKPSQHKSLIGNISAAMGARFSENVVTSTEVSNQDFIKTGDTAGPFATAKPGNRGTFFEIDIVFPVGQTDPDTDGEIKGRQTVFRITYQELDDNDVLVGSPVSLNITASTRADGNPVSGPNATNINVTTANEKNKTEIGSPLRRTYRVNTGRSARWSVKIYRITDSPNAKNGGDRFIWAGLKLYVDTPASSVYGNVTLLACRIKASQGLGQDASVKLRVRAIRQLAQPSGGAIAQSTSAADAFADAYTDAVYGAARPRSELDVTTLNTVRAKWAAYPFNYVFKDRGTVWDALRTITAPYSAQPMPLGAMMSVAQDGIKPIRSALFTDANIVSDSMMINYSFDEEGASDGVEIEYLDPKDFKQIYVTYPAGAFRPESYSLLGVTSTPHATEYATLSWNRRQQQRKTITFDTELEGLLLQLGDRIGVSHNVPKWGDGGLIVGISGLVLTADHELDWSGTAAKQIVLRKQDGGVTDPISVAKGATPDKIVLLSPTLPTINIDNDYEYTSFAFGSATTLVRDFIVTRTTPNGDNTVTVEAVNYAPAIYAGAMKFLV